MDARLIAIGALGGLVGALLSAVIVGRITRALEKRNEALRQEVEQMRARSRT